MLKYTLARLGLFVAVAGIALVMPVPENVYLKLAIALLVSAGLGVFVLRGMREEVNVYVAEMVQKRKESRERLRAALAGEDSPKE
jgi:fucose permease